MNTSTVEDVFGRLQLELNEKKSEIKAIDVQLKASEQRFDDAAPRESESQVALKKVSTELDKAQKQLTKARPTAEKVIAQANADAATIRAKSRDEAAGFLQGIRSAVAAAAGLIESK